MAVGLDAGQFAQRRCRGRLVPYDEDVVGAIVKPDVHVPAMQRPQNVLLIQIGQHTVCAVKEPLQGQAGALRTGRPCADPFAEPVEQALSRPVCRARGCLVLQVQQEQLHLMAQDAQLCELPLKLDEDAQTAKTAIYDITARTVYMPNGDKLEAHSGFGEFMDNPKHVRLRMRGVTPPNTYKLTMREALFHGHEAIRMNPENREAMFGRAGILVHPYLLGPNGQSNG